MNTKLAFHTHKAKFTRLDPNEPPFHYCPVCKCEPWTVTGEGKAPKNGKS